LRKCVLQHLYPNKLGTYLQHAECTSAVCDDTAVVSVDFWRFWCTYV